MKPQQLTIVLFLVLLVFAALLPAQAGTPTAPAAEPLSRGTSVIEVELRDRVGFVSDFSQAVAVVAWLPDDHIPFDEFTQGQWSHRFAQIAVHPTLPSDVELALTRDNEALRGKAYNVPSSGRLSIDQMPENQRLALAVYFEGVWWPLKREIWFEDIESYETALVDVHAVSHDMSTLEAPSYVIDLKSYWSTLQLSWHTVEVVEQITIRNLSQTHAVIGDAALKDEPWLRLQLTPPPGIEPQELISDFLIGQWSFFVGEKQVEGFPFEEGQDRHLMPYRPWTFGRTWTNIGSAVGPNPHGGAGHGAGPTSRQYFQPGRKTSGDNAHPLNREGLFEFLGAGDVSVQFVDDELFLVFNKPIPPAREITIVVAQRPGISFAAPQPIHLYRWNFPFPLLEVRAKSEPLFNLTSNGGMKLPALETGADNMLRAFLGGDGKPVLKADDPLEWVIAPSGELAAMLSETNQQLAEEEAREAAVNPADGVTRPRKEEGVRLVALMWLAASLFGLAFLVALVWMVRGSTADQLKAVRPALSMVDEAIQELARLEQDLETRRIPPAVYLKERERIVEYLVEAELSRNAKTHNDTSK